MPSQLPYYGILPMHDDGKYVHWKYVAMLHIPTFPVRWTWYFFDCALKHKYRLQSLGGVFNAI